MPFTFFNEFGTEPIAYVGLKIQRAELDDSIHELESTELKATRIVTIESSIHELFSGNLRATYTGVLEDSIHHHFTYRKWNAPVSPICATYLQTYFADRYLDTEEEERYLQTEFEDHYLDTEAKCT